MMEAQSIYDFDKDSKLNNWYIVDDVVMGGRSNGNFDLSKDGHGLFSGEVSLENNGGFSSVRFNSERISTKGYSKIALKIKGDGKNYQLRIKAQDKEYYSYVKYFPTSGEWEEVEVLLKDMYPSFRGRTLDMPNFDKEQIEELAILIANKKAERFELLIDKIELR